MQIFEIIRYIYFEGFFKSEIGGDSIGICCDNL